MSSNIDSQVTGVGVSVDQGTKIMTVSVSIKLDVQSPATPQPPSITVRTGLLVPLYTYPADGSWDKLVAAHNQYPSVPIIAVINPNSGPGTAPDPNYADGIRKLKLAGIKVLGYVHTGYGTRSLPLVEDDVKKYISFYQLFGIFVDEVAAVGGEFYLSTLSSDCKTLGVNFMLGNPGTKIPQSYVGIFDNFCVYEGEGYPWNVAANMGDTSVIAEHIISYDSAQTRSMASWPGVKYIYVTDQPDTGNTYGVITPYLVQLLADLASL